MEVTVASVDCHYAIDESKWSANKLETCKCFVKAEE